MLEPAIVSGLTSAGMDIITFGPIPTNALAMLTRSMKADIGIMITASHNPYHDNGLKLFGPDGLKLSDEVEKKIEKLIDAPKNKLLVPVKELGRVKRLEDGNSRYIEILKSNFPADFDLKGMKVVVDAANGAIRLINIGWKLCALVSVGKPAPIVSQAARGRKRGHFVNL